MEYSAKIRTRVNPGQKPPQEYFWLGRATENLYGFLVPSVATPKIRCDHKAASTSLNISMQSLLLHRSARQQSSLCGLHNADIWFPPDPAHPHPHSLMYHRHTLFASHRHRCFKSFVIASRFLTDGGNGSRRIFALTLSCPRRTPLSN